MSEHYLENRKSILLENRSVKGAYAINSGFIAVEELSVALPLSYVEISIKNM